MRTYLECSCSWPLTWYIVSGTWYIPAHIQLPGIYLLMFIYLIYKSPLISTYLVSSSSCSPYLAYSCLQMYVHLPGIFLLMSTYLVYSCSCQLTWYIPAHVNFPGIFLLISTYLVYTCSCPVTWQIPVHGNLPGIFLLMSTYLVYSCSCPLPGIFLLMYTYLVCSCPCPPTWYIPARILLLNIPTHVRLPGIQSGGMACVGAALQTPLVMVYCVLCQ